MNIENMIHVPTVEPGEKDYRGEDGLLRCGVCGEPKEAFFEGGFLLGGKDRHPVQCRCQREAKAKQEAEYREQQHGIPTAAAGFSESDHAEVDV